MFSFTFRGNSPYRIFAAGVLLIAACAIVVPCSAQAGCNQKGKGRDCKGVTSLDSNSSLAAIDGTHFYFDADALLKCTSAATNTADSGAYFCSDPPDLFMSTRMMTGMFARRFWDICHTFLPGDGENGFLLTPDAVSYGWIDDCSDGDCAIELQAEFSGLDLEALTHGDADRLNMVMHGKVYDALEADPFAQDQIVIIDRIGLAFFRPGSDRSAGTCDWYTDLSEDQVGLYSLDE